MTQVAVQRSKKVFSLLMAPGAFGWIPELPRALLYLHADVPMRRAKTPSVFFRSRAGNGTEKGAWPAHSLTCRSQPSSPHAPARPEPSAVTQAQLYLYGADNGPLRHPAAAHSHSRSAAAAPCQHVRTPRFPNALSPPAFPLAPPQAHARHSGCCHDRGAQSASRRPHMFGGGHLLAAGIPVPSAARTLSAKAAPPTRPSRAAPRARTCSEAAAAIFLGCRRGCGSSALPLPERGGGAARRRPAALRRDADRLPGALRCGSAPWPSRASPSPSRHSHGPDVRRGPAPRWPRVAERFSRSEAFEAGKRLLE